MSTLKVNTIEPYSGTTVAVTGTLDVSGTIKSYAFETITTLSSEHSGSNSFGNDGSDTHQFTGSVVLNNALNVTGSSALASITATAYSGSSTLEAVGNTILGGNLNVSGSTTFAGSVGALTATTISGSSTLQAVGATTLGSSLDVSGSVTLGDAAADVTTVTGRLTGSQGAYFAKRVGIGTASPSDTLTVAGSLSGSSTLHAVGAATFGSTLATTGSITSGGSFIIGSADINETDLEKLDGITNGTVTANKAVVVDGSKNIATLGTVGCGAITSTGASTYGSLSGGAISGSSTLHMVGPATFGNTLATTGSVTIGADADGTDRTITFGHTTLKTIMGIDDSADAFVINTDDAFDGTLANNSLSIDASHNMIVAGNVTAGGSFVIGSADMNETDLEKLDGITNGTAAANKAVVLDGSKNIATLGTVGCGAITSTGASTYGSLSGGAISGSSTLQAVGATTLGGTLNVSGSTTFGIDDIGADVRIHSATTNEGVFYDASEDALALLLTTKLKFHDVTGDEEIFASSNGHLEVNAGTTLDMTAPTVDINASTGISLDTPSVVVTSATANKPLVILVNDADNAASAVLRFVQDGRASGGGAANDDVGLIEFYGDDAAQSQVLFAKILAEVATHTDGQEGGKLTLGVASHDGEMNAGLVLTDGSAEDEIDVTIGNGAASVTTVAGDLTVNGGDVTIAGATPRLTVGDNEAEDCSIVLDNGTQDYYLGIDHDDSQKFILGGGSTVGNNAALTITSAGAATFGSTLATTGSVTIGADADGTDRTITFGHTTLKTIMGIDDSADAFVINTDNAFDGTLANNSLSIDASHNMIVAGNITGKGRVIVDDATEASTTSDGSLQTDGGLSVAKSAVIGDDLDLLSDSAVLNIGSSNKFTATHANANNTLTVTANHRLAFGAAADYIVGDGTDISIVGSGKINYNATGHHLFTGSMYMSASTLDVRGTGDAGSAEDGGSAGTLRLICDDGARMDEDHRIGAIDFVAAEDSNGVLATGARIEAVADENWNASANAASLMFYTTTGNNEQFQQLMLGSDGVHSLGTGRDNYEPAVGSTYGLDIVNQTTAGATQGGALRLTCDDGTVMVANDRLGVIEFAGAEDTSSNVTVGARIEAVAEGTWSASENGTKLVFYTTDGDASQSEVLKLDSNKRATFAGGTTITAGAVICGRETVAAAGTGQGDGTSVTCSHPFVAVTGADNTKGVTLAAVSGLTAGQMIKIFNFSANTLEVYPASGDRIYPAADNAGITVAAYGFLELMVYDATGWVGNEGVIAA